VLFPAWRRRRRGKSGSFPRQFFVLKRGGYSQCLVPIKIPFGSESKRLLNKALVTRDIPIESDPVRIHLT
jgi:hypothetical protein